MDVKIHYLLLVGTQANVVDGLSVPSTYELS